MSAFRPNASFHTPMAARAQRGSAAFSLVEVTLALGLVAFAVLAVMATIPLGLSTLGDARDQTTEAHILSGLAAKIGTLSFTELSELDSKVTFDFEGQPVSGQERERAVYEVRMSTIEPIYAGGPSDPGRTLRTVQIVVSNLHRPAIPSNSYTVHVAKSE